MRATSLGVDLETLAHELAAARGDSAKVGTLQRVRTALLYVSCGSEFTVSRSDFGFGAHLPDIKWSRCCKGSYSTLMPQRAHNQTQQAAAA